MADQITELKKLLAVWDYSYLRFLAFRRSDFSTERASEGGLKYTGEMNRYRKDIESILTSMPSPAREQFKDKIKDINLRTDLAITEHKYLIKFWELKRKFDAAEIIWDKTALEMEAASKKGSLKSEGIKIYIKEIKNQELIARAILEEIYSLIKERGYRRGFVPDMHSELSQKFEYKINKTNDTIKFCLSKVASRS